MDTRDATIARLHDRIAELEETVRQMRALVEGQDMFSRLPVRLSRTEHRILVALYERGGDGATARREMIVDRLYFDRVNPPLEKIVDVYMTKLRKKLRPLGVEIEAVWGVGYTLSKASTAILRGYQLEQAA